MANSGQAVGYCRVSTDKQSGSDHYSLALQSEMLKKMAVQHQTVLAAIFTDIASGSKTTRTGLQQLRESVERPDVKWLFVYRLNRLARNLKLLLSIFELCQTNNVKVVSKMEPEITETASGQLQLSIFGAVAELERSLTLENQANALAEKKRQGEVLSSRVPYGYVYRAKHAIVDPETAPVVQWLYQQYSCSDMGYRRLTAACNQHFGVNLKQAHVAGILRNEHYTDSESNYPTLIDQKLFNRAKTKRLNQQSKKTRGDAWLHGKLVCPVCGRKLLVVSVIKPKRRYRYYRCHQRDHTFSVSGRMIEQLVWQTLTSLAKASDLKMVMQTKADCQLPRISGITPAELVSQLEDGRLTSQQYIEQTKQLKDEQQVYQQRKQEVQLAINQVLAAVESPTTELMTVWQSLLDRVELSPEKLVIGIYLKQWPTANLLDMEGVKLDE
ncbi:recombinase family protein [Levilactobacillus brevis]|uniref:recombinase family protein n=1 Tax=Levilactobacillus brevis TaxID=1580 RepID=UPI00116548F5|nr:recombinase family protein [Levilactobacillus brevis]QCZ42428.1 cassette chromosome recombinase A [Levilactobacillus brevis]